MFKHYLDIGGIRFTPPLVLAPMVGLSHSALRSLLMEIGGVGIFFTEMLSAKRLPSENETVSPYLIRSPDEHPLFYQIYLNDLSFIDPAIERLHSLNAQGVDVNLGCPAPRIKKCGAGGKLAADPRKTEKIIKKLRNSTHLPLSVKIRIGETGDRAKFLDFCSRLEQTGIDLLTIHARLANEKFCRKPRWSYIEKAKSILSIPVLANGGIHSTETALQCLSQTGADGLMIGRAAPTKPWIFQEIASSLFGMQRQNDSINPYKVYLRFAELLQNRFPAERRLGRLKQFTHYFTEQFPFGHHLASAVQKSHTMETALSEVNSFFTRNTALHSLEGI